MFGILVILFTVLPALEFYLLFKIGSNIGAVNTLALIILTGIVGAFLAKREGLSIIYKIQDQLNLGSLPGKEIIHGFLVFGGGLLLLTPGFITDFIGLAMVFPGSRHLIVAFAQKWLVKAMEKGTV
ncbi:MAG: FxsA family protein, partial [Bacteriovoracaceae bacterium]